MLSNTITITAKDVDGTEIGSKTYSRDTDSSNTSEYVEMSHSDDSKDMLLHSRKRGVRNGNYRGTNRSKVTTQKGHLVPGFDPDTNVRAQSNVSTEVVTPVGTPREIVRDLVAYQAAYMLTDEFIDEVCMKSQV